MTERDYSKLSKTLIITDMYETDAEPLVLGGVAIPAERCEEFIEAVEKLAVEQFGGATFGELLDNDLEDEAASASSIQYDKEQVDAVLQVATKILKQASDQ
ncbi:hypothetical protein HMPREF1008_00280 [Olsenella sp. oral taxon 809 str. F0356]|uniref:hypothetical protein n=1 Tax=Olsenella sp. oral taxon 809 TaxID=661086 RepID=UPI000231F0D7|nr:hypothetical protein [Olsenella sp. oral taxon 809]EHF02635.1 hypothetical protein HMPREF1008_00280 [Olsenella sp. oral taxon 809 str. F0356]